MRVNGGCVGLHALGGPIVKRKTECKGLDPRRATLSQEYLNAANFFLYWLFEEMFVSDLKPWGRQKMGTALPECPGQTDRNPICGFSQIRNLLRVVDGLVFYMGGAPIPTGCEVCFEKCIRRLGGHIFAPALSFIEKEHRSVFKGRGFKRSQLISRLGRAVLLSGRNSLVLFFLRICETNAALPFSQLKPGFGLPMLGRKTKKKNLLISGSPVFRVDRSRKRTEKRKKREKEV